MADQRIIDLLNTAVHWRLLSMLLACPQGAWRSQVAALAAEVVDDTLRQAAAAMIREASEGLYHTTLGPGGPAAPREVSHREYMVPGAFLAELQASYDAFSFRPLTDEPLDHVAVEADFLAYLHMKEAFAIARGDRQQAEIAAEAARHFLQTHLAVIAEPLARSLHASGITYLQLAAQALCEAAGPAPRTENTVERLSPPCDDNMSCGCL